MGTKTITLNLQESVLRLHEHLSFVKEELDWIQWPVFRVIRNFCHFNFFKREREMWGVGQRGERENLKQAPSSAQSLMQDLSP